MIAPMGAESRKTSMKAYKVAESGIGSADDVRRVADAGARAILVGEALMRSADPGRMVRELTGGGGAR